MDKLSSILPILLVGGGLSVLFYWIGIITGKLSVNSYGIKWWIRLVVQGVVLAAALKIFKVF